MIPILQVKNLRPERLSGLSEVTQLGGGCGQWIDPGASYNLFYLQLASLQKADHIILSQAPHRSMGMASILLLRKSVPPSANILSQVCTSFPIGSLLTLRTSP